MAHALASPLTLIQGRVQLLERDAANCDLGRAVQQIQEQVRRITELLERVQRFGRRLRPAAEASALETELSALAAFEPVAGAAGVEIAIPAEAGSRVIERGALQEIVRHLLHYTAWRHVGGAISIEQCSANDHDCVRIRLMLDAELPVTKRALSEPWLEDTEADVSARFELAMALNVARDASGWHELEAPRPNVVSSLAVYLPLRA